MTPLFFYGTLRHEPLLERVLGRPATTLDTDDAMLADHAVLAVAEGPFPMIVARPGAMAVGRVVRALTPQDVDRITFYEAGFAYDLVPVTLISGEAAQVFVPRADTWTDAGPWDFEAWEARWADLAVEAADEVMSYVGSRDADHVARTFDRIRARAWSRVNARHTRSGPDAFTGRIEIEARSRAYSGFFALEELRLRHETFDGGMSPPLDRAVFVVSDASFVLPYDPVRDRVLLVEQIRMGPIVRGDAHPWQLEPVAGLIDPGETPQEAALRETHEETGLTPTRLEPMGAAYASPGCTTDYFHLFLGLCDLPDDTPRIAGHADEGENIRSRLMSFDALMAMVEGRTAANVPLMTMAYWLAHHRARLRCA